MAWQKLIGPTPTVQIACEIDKYQTAKARGLQLLLSQEHSSLFMILSFSFFLSIL